jgi:hypothetical protein
VETVYSMVGGEGRRVWRWGAVASILGRMVGGSRVGSFELISFGRPGRFIDKRRG